MEASAAVEPYLRARTENLHAQWIWGHIQTEWGQLTERNEENSVYSETQELPKEERDMTRNLIWSRPGGALMDGKFCSARVGYWWATLHKKSSAAANFSWLTHWWFPAKRTALSGLLSSWKISCPISIKTECQVSGIMETQRGESSTEKDKDADKQTKRGGNAHALRTLLPRGLGDVSDSSDKFVSPEWLGTNPRLWLRRSALYLYFL